MTSKRTFTIIYIEITKCGGERNLSDTKKRILYVALELFSKRGYDAVSVSDIASKIGITKGALYRHYKNKRDIFDSILLFMEERDRNGADEYDLPVYTFEDEPESYANISLKQLVKYSESQFLYWTKDEFARMFRQMITIEQYKNEEMKNLYQNYIASGPYFYVLDLLRSIGIKNSDEEALEFFSPMVYLYSMYDGTDDKKTVIKLAKQHFEKSYLKLIKLSDGKEE